MRDAYRPQNKRNRLGTLIFAGVGVLFGAYVPAYFLFPRKAALVVSMAVSLLVLILIASHFTTIRRGVLGGAILGLLGGVGCLLGMTNAMMAIEIGIANEAHRQAQEATADQPAEPVEGAEPAEPVVTAEPAPADQPLQSADADEPAATDDPAGPAKPQVSLSPEQHERITAMQGQLMMISLPPNILLGAFIGGVFAKAGIRRREMYG